MSTLESKGSPSVTQPNTGREPVTGYHWLVVILASGGWLFDCMSQRIFILGREPAFRELLGAAASDADVKYWGGLATFVMMAGWATGGIIFGIMSDRYGRVKVMVAALLAYTVFSAVSGFARSGIEFLVYRFLFGLGVGGMFGAATTLLAESVPAHFRTVALGSMQAIASSGNMAASLLSLGITPGQENFWGRYSGWQVLFFVGMFPAVMAVPMWLFLREPEPWKKAKAQAATSGPGKSVGSMRDLFFHPRWRRSTLVGICLGVSGMVGLWGIAFFSPELITTALKDWALKPADIRNPTALARALAAPTNDAASTIAGKLPPDVLSELRGLGPRAEVPASTLDRLAAGLNTAIQEGTLYQASAFKGLALKKQTANLLESLRKTHNHKDTVFLNRQLVEQTFPGTIRELQKTIDRTRSQGTLLQDVGALLGMFAFTFVAARFSRRTAFLTAFVGCLVSVGFVFYALKTETDVYWMLPVMGFTTLSVFAGYSIYFPEIFPTRLRGTGVGFCYNTVRYLAAPFPLLLGWLSTHFPFRTVAVAMSGIYLLGMLALIWAPETKGKPLPED